MKSKDHEGLLVAADRWLHRVMRGRCYNRRLCLKISYWQAMRDIKETQGKG